MTALPYIAPSIGPVVTTAQQVSQAQTLVNAYLKRPEGLLWHADHLGRPAYMDALYPHTSLVALAGIAQGVNVVVNLPNVRPIDDWVGQPVTIDKAGGQSLTETARIVAISDNSITLDTVLLAHASGTKLDLGLQVRDQRQVPKDRAVTRVSRPPVRVLCGQGRYGTGRRGDRYLASYSEPSLASIAVSTFGAAYWQPITERNVSASQQTGEVWLGSGILGDTYAEVRLYYLSGFNAAGDVPEAIKQATDMTAQAIAMQQLGAAAYSAALTPPAGGVGPIPAGMAGTITKYRAGDTEISTSGAGNGGSVAGRAAQSSSIPPDAKGLLAPFRAWNFA